MTLENEMTMLGRVAHSVGATEPALRLLISILVGKYLNLNLNFFFF